VGRGKLAYRLTRFNLQVLYDQGAVQYMNRSVTFDDFCARCERQGRSQARFGRLHAEWRVQEYCQIPQVAQRWAAIEPQLPGAVERVRDLEATLARPRRRQEDALIDELHGLYRRTFEGFKIKGIAEALEREH